MRLNARPVPIPGWSLGRIQDMEPDAAPPGTIEDARNMVSLDAGQVTPRGGSKTTDDFTADSIDLMLNAAPFGPTGLMAVGHDAGASVHHGYRLDADGAFFTGAIATSRVDLTASPSTDWDTAAAHRPVMAEMFEKMFIADADPTYSSRATLLSVDGSGTLLEPNFKFGSGSAQALRPFCLEEYNSHLFIAGYGSEDTSDDDRREIIRHSFLGRSADDVTGGAEGFDPLAWLILGQKGVQVTGLRKGRGLLIAAKRNELYRISGFGRAYPGWQFSVE